MRPILLKGHERALTQVVYNHDGDLLFSAAKDNCVNAWWADSGERFGTYVGHKGTIWKIDVSYDSTRLLTAGADQCVRVWNVQTGEMLVNLQHPGPVRVVAWAEGDRRFFTSSATFMKSGPRSFMYDCPVDLEAGSSPDLLPKTEWEPFIQKPNMVNAARFLPLNACVLTGDHNGVIRLHNTDTGVVLYEVKDEHTKTIQDLQMNKDKTLLVTSSADCSCRVFAIHRCEAGSPSPFRLERVQMFTTPVPVNSAAISPIREHVLLGGGEQAMNVTQTSSQSGKFEARFFHLVFGDEFGRIKGHFGPINSLAFAPDGHGYASGAEDGFIRLHHFDKDYFQHHSEYADLTELQEDNDILEQELRQ